LHAASLWFTVQGAIAYIEGCVASIAIEKPLEDLARAIPGVRQVLVLMLSADRAKPPYATLSRGRE
jgi:hypothetical protein